ncbi:MAG: Uma2 family endonuclease [Chitinophagaceae bacterium]
MENEVNEPAPKYNYISPEEYLATERAVEEKNEYYDGQVLAMSGASFKHNHISQNLSKNLGVFLEDKECSILSSNMRVSTPSHDAYMYPDAIIYCGDPVLEDDKFDTLLNPSVIFEILSPSTRSIDKGRKFFFYQAIPSLREYIMIDSQKIFIQLNRKQLDGTWVIEMITDLNASLTITSIDARLLLKEIYSKTGL